MRDFEDVAGEGHGLRSAQLYVNFSTEVGQDEGGPVTHTHTAHRLKVPLVRMDRIERIPGGTRQNDGLETGLGGAYGRDISAVKPVRRRSCKTNTKLRVAP